MNGGNSVTHLWVPQARKSALSINRKCCLSWGCLLAVFAFHFVVVRFPCRLPLIDWFYLKRQPTGVCPRVHQSVPLPVYIINPITQSDHHSCHPPTVQAQLPIKRGRQLTIQPTKLHPTHLKASNQPTKVLYSHHLRPRKRTNATQT